MVDYWVGKVFSCSRIVRHNYGNPPLILVCSRNQNYFSRPNGHSTCPFWVQKTNRWFWYVCWAYHKSCDSWPIIYLFQVDNVESFSRCHVTSKWCEPNHAIMERIVPNGILNQKPSKWFKMAKLCNVLMLGNVEDECTFSNLAFMKTKFWNWLITHFDLDVYMYV